MVVGLRFAIVVVWVCVLGGCHGIRWRGFGFAGVGGGGFGFAGVGMVGLGGCYGIRWHGFRFAGVSCGGFGFAGVGIVGLGGPAWVWVCWYGFEIGVREGD